MKLSLQLQPAKQKIHFSPDERIQIAEKIFEGNNTVVGFSGLLVDLAKDNAKILIRGLQLLPILNMNFN